MRGAEGGHFSFPGPLPRPNTITYTSLVLAYSKDGRHDQVLQLFALLRGDGVASNMPILQCVLTAAEKCSEWALAVDTIQGMTNAGIVPSTLEYNLAITACAKSARTEEALGVLASMRADNVSRNIVSYNAAIASCRASGDWTRAVALLDTMRSDGVHPDTFTYSSVISVCVAGQQWELALELLEAMETLHIARNVVTYNSAIEALHAAGETVRAELVYQSALRSGVYSHWHVPGPGSAVRNDSFDTMDAAYKSPGHRGALTMDLHRLPTAVSRTAVMHVLGEMAAGILPIADLVIVTGRGNHVNRDGSRGVLRAELVPFFAGLGLETTTVRDNAGRLAISQRSLDGWMAGQRARNDSASSVHSNLFLQVAFAKQKRNANVRAACPFSAATSPVAAPSNVNLDKENLSEKCSHETTATNALPLCPNHPDNKRAL